MSSPSESANAPTHAGGIVVRTDGLAPRFLIVQALSNASHWVLPKGHIEAGESPQDAAIREVQEETGVTAEIIGSVEEVSFTFGGKPIVVAYYHMRYVSGGLPVEERPTKWCRYEEAASLLTFADARQVLEKVAQRDQPG